MTGCRGEVIIKNVNASVTAPEESMRPSITSTRIGLANWTTGNLCLRTNLSSINHIVSPESRSAKDLIEIDLTWMLTGKKKSFVDVAELWEPHECRLSDHMAPTVVGHRRLPVVGAVLSYCL